MRRCACMLALLLLSCRDGGSAPPMVVVPAPSAAASTDPTSSPSAEDAGPPVVRDARFDFLRDTPPTKVKALLDALGVPVTAVWQSPEQSGMGSFSAKSPSAEIAYLSVTYHWDIHHTSRVSKPEALLEKSLEEWSITLPSARREACVRALSRWGAPVAKEAPDHAAVEQYGSFFVTPAAAETFRLEWFSRTPDWAKPKVDPAVRKKAVADLAKAVATAKTLEELARAAATPYPGAGITSKGSYNKNDESIEFEPPMNALEFAAAIGHPSVTAESVGVHMSEWRLRDVTGSQTAYPKLGTWEVEASLATRPTGAKDGRFGTGPTAHYLVGAGDLVRYVRFATPRP